MGKIGKIYHGAEIYNLLFGVPGHVQNYLYRCAASGKPFVAVILKDADGKFVDMIGFSTEFGDEPVRRFINLIGKYHYDIAHKAHHPPPYEVLVIFKPDNITNEYMVLYNFNIHKPENLSEVEAKISVQRNHYIV
ncbi:MAG: hypothetical protein ACTSUO_00140 [Candidatus Thorarchaeota archaeon]